MEWRSAPSTSTLEPVSNRDDDDGEDGDDGGREPFLRSVRSVRLVSRRKGLGSLPGHSCLTRAARMQSTSTGVRVIARQSEEFVWCNEEFVWCSVRICVGVARNTRRWSRSFRNEVHRGRAAQQGPLDRCGCLVHETALAR